MRQRDSLEDFRNQKTQRLGDVLAAIVDGLGISRGITRSKLEEAWREAVGDEAAHHCRVVGVRKNVLTVAVDSSVWKQEIGTMRKAEILGKMQEAETGECIRKLKVELAGSTAFCESSTRVRGSPR